jgi:HSP20 family protein
MSPFDELQREMERYLAHFARTGKRPTIVFTQHMHGGPVWTPAVDVYETAEALVVLLELAGIDPSQTEVHAEPGRLVVRGARQERYDAGAEERRTYHALEIAYGPFERMLPLPSGLDTAAARASYHDGFLRITLPKRAPHQVKIASGGQPGTEQPA